MKGMRQRVRDRVHAHEIPGWQAAPRPLSRASRRRSVRAAGRVAPPGAREAVVARVPDIRFSSVAPWGPWEAGRTWRPGRHATARGAAARRGTTLVEVIAAVTVASAILGSGALLLVQILRIEAGEREEAHRFTAVGRLSARLRQDVAQATQMVLRRAGAESSTAPRGRGVPLLTLMLPAPEQVDYIVRPDVLYRLARPASGLRRERYRLPAGWKCTLHIEEERAGRWLVMCLQAPPTSGEGWQYCIEASVGQHVAQAEGEARP